VQVRTVGQARSRGADPGQENTAGVDPW